MNARDLPVAADPTDHPILSQVALGYAPMIDRQRSITALRLTVFPTPGQPVPDAHALLSVLARVWPAESGRLSLNVVGEALLAGVMRAEPPPHLMVEVPAFVAAQPDQAELLKAMHRRGNALLLKGRPISPLPPELLRCFDYSIIDLADERRGPLPMPGDSVRRVPHVQSGITRMDQLGDAFARGAIAVLGWPFDDLAVPSDARPKPVKASMATVVELINRVDRQEPIDRLEAVVKHDPTLAYKLLKYINSPAFGLRVEITTFAHAIMMLGYQRMKRWLALLLVSGAGDPAQRPLVYAAVRRGLLMEELARDADIDEAQRGELFVCGVFSLLDRIVQQPFAALLASVPTSDAVRDALESARGPFAPYLALVQAVESSSVYDVRDCADALMTALTSVNRAVLRALVSARQLD